MSLCKLERLSSQIVIWLAKSCCCFSIINLILFARDSILGFFPSNFSVRWKRGCGNIETRLITIRLEEKESSSSLQTEQVSALLRAFSVQSFFSSKVNLHVSSGSLYYFSLSPTQIVSPEIIWFCACLLYAQLI
jgi:hypothetical protein